MEDTMEIAFRGRGQRGRYNLLAARNMSLTYYPDLFAMTTLGIHDSVLFLLNQIGWEDAHILRRFSTYRKLTLEFLSSFNYLPHYGKDLKRGLIFFRLFGMEYRYNLHDFSALLGFPDGFDTFTSKQEELFDYRELDIFWESLTGLSSFEHPEPHADYIHNPAFRYFHHILSHTLFGKEQNNTIVSRDELFIMLCAVQNRPVNGVAFLLVTIEKMLQDDNMPIVMGGMVTMIANALGLRQPLLSCHPYGGIRPMDLNFCFNKRLIGNHGPREFELLINNEVVNLFTLPSPRTSVHDKGNWLYNLDGLPSPARSTETIQDYEIPEIYEIESDPETPPGYHDFPEQPLSPPVTPVIEENRQGSEPMNQEETIKELKEEVKNLKENLTAANNEVNTLRMDHFGFVDTVAMQFDEVFQHIYSMQKNNGDDNNKSG